MDIDDISSNSKDRLKVYETRENIPFNKTTKLGEDEFSQFDEIFNMSNQTKTNQKLNMDNFKEIPISTENVIDQDENLEQDFYNMSKEAKNAEKENNPKDDKHEKGPQTEKM